MKLNLKFINKLPKGTKINEIIFVKQKNIKNKILKPLNSHIFSNKLFIEQSFLLKDINNKSYVLVNCIEAKTTLDYEKIGSKLYEFLKNNKIEKSYIDVKTNFLTNIQIEKILHGVQLKSYEFNIYKSNKKKLDLNLTVIENNKQRSNSLRKKLNALLEGVFLTRDLVSEPGNVLHPDEYANELLN